MPVNGFKERPNLTKNILLLKPLQIQMDTKAHTHNNMRGYSEPIKL